MAVSTAASPRSPSSTIFGGVSGSAVAEASALGSMLIPWQKREGYPPAFAAATTASSAAIAGLIPPSIPLILYAAVSNASIGLGAIGTPMALNLVKAGFEVRGYDVRPEAVAALATAGGRAATSAAEAAELSF